MTGTQTARSSNRLMSTRVVKAPAPDARTRSVDGRPILPGPRSEQAHGAQRLSERESGRLDLPRNPRQPRKPRAERATCPSRPPTRRTRISPVRRSVIHDYARAAHVQPPDCEPVPCRRGHGCGRGSSAPGPQPAHLMRGMPTFTSQPKGRTTIHRVYFAKMRHRPLPSVLLRLEGNQFSWCS